MSRRPSPRDRRLSMRFLGVFTPFSASISGRSSAKGFHAVRRAGGSIALLFPLPHHLPSSMGPSPKGATVVPAGSACRRAALFAFCFLRVHDIPTRRKSQPLFYVFSAFFRLFRAFVKTYHNVRILRGLPCIIPDNGVFPGAAAASYICACPPVGLACPPVGLPAAVGLAARPWACLPARGACLPPVGLACRPWGLPAARGLACPPVGLACPPVGRSKRQLVMTTQL